MQSLPYELLQHVATWLLPRYQCRFALASKWCYRYLYTPLLRWHAKKALIPVPKYKIYCKKHIITSVLFIPSQKPRVVLLTIDYEMVARSLTDMRISLNDYDYVHYNVKTMRYMELYYLFKVYRKFDILAGYYQYIHKDALLLYVNMRQPIFSLNRKLLYYITNKMYNGDRCNLLFAHIA